MCIGFGVGDDEQVVVSLAVEDETEEAPEKPELPAVVHESMLQVVGEVVRGNGEPAYVGSDGTLFQRTAGAVQALVPMGERFAAEWRTAVAEGKGETAVNGWMEDAEPDGLLESLDLKFCPPTWALKQLHEDLLRKYDREVGVFNGLKRDGTFVFVVPEQEGTAGGIDIDDASEALETMREAGGRVVGITHCHPGSWTGRSGIDEGSFERWNGIHPILSEDRATMRLHGSVRGYIWSLEEVSLKGARRPKAMAPVEILRAAGKPLAELLKEPKPVVVTAADVNKAVAATEAATTRSRRRGWETQGWNQTGRYGMPSNCIRSARQLLQARKMG
jgi:hypothetical protein